MIKINWYFDVEDQFVRVLGLKEGKYFKGCIEI
jgi:hypothetical protein